MSFPSDHEAEPSSSSYSLKPLEFTLPQIVDATNDFDESRLLGSGGFGRVYKGIITYKGKPLVVAMKRLAPGSADIEQVFWYEVTLHSYLKHPHLVFLIGYCSDEQELIFVYEYMSRGTLEDRLHKGGVPMNWLRRLKICLDTARGLEYFQREMDTKSMALHLDVKSSNILLASNWKAKVSDFGTSKVRPTDSTYETLYVPGTWGYRAPEFLQTGTATRKTDVYSFGVVLLEVLSAKKAVFTSTDGERNSLATWAQDSIVKKKLDEIIDPNLRGRIPSKCLKEFILLAHSCLHIQPEQRPTMEKVVNDLESILASQEKADRKLLTKLFRAKVSNLEEPYKSLKSLDRYLYTVGSEDHVFYRFDHKTLVQATENFSEANKVWSDSYSSISRYKGRLQSGQAITITKFHTNFYHQCMKEVSTLGKLENGIQLLGYCIKGKHVYLIYNFAVNATLGDLLFDLECDVLDWSKRSKIMLGVARELYLHNHEPFQIIHLDVQPENILLNESFEPKLSNYGFLVIDNDVVHPDELLHEEFWRTWTSDRYYPAPWSTKADVFDFGVLIFNIITGKKRFDDSRTGIGRDACWLQHYVRINWLQGTLSDIIDPRIINDESCILLTKFIEIGLLCVQEDATVRPTMEKVVEMLLDTLSPTHHVSRMQARMINGQQLSFVDNMSSPSESFVNMSSPSEHEAEPSSSSYSPKLLEFTLPQIVDTTNGFDKSRLLGSGGFGHVHKGTVTYKGKPLVVAIKRLKPSSSEGVSGSSEREQVLWYEVTLHSHLKHPHLVSLIGYCGDGQELIFVYEYMSRGTLEDRLHKGGVPLSWLRRLKICLDTARGLKYYQIEMDTKSMALHLDVKSSNILLASNWQAKVSDFGTSKVHPTDSTYETVHVPGTWGYRAPEFLQAGTTNRKIDVYAFGVVMLEVLCVKKALFRSSNEELKSFATLAQDSITGKKLEEIIDPHLRGRMPSNKCLKEFVLLAHSCLHTQPEQRPTMEKIVNDLESILASQEEADGKLLTELFGEEVSNLEDPSVEFAVAERISSKSLDKYLYTVGGEDRVLYRFDYNTLVQATQNFSEANKLRSDYSVFQNFIYKGRLQTGQAITITEFQGPFFFHLCTSEVLTLVKLENAIQLLGYCIKGEHLYLIYNFAVNATLAGLLFDSECDVLDWSKRSKIILGVARELVNLHNHEPFQIIHLYVQPESILLDESFEPKLWDFRFALADHNADHTDGHWLDGFERFWPPEPLRKWSTKTDVFIFGVLIFNIITGQKTVDYRRPTSHKRDVETDNMLIGYVQRNWLQGTLSDIIDPRIINAESYIPLLNFIEIGLLCVQEDNMDRPTIQNVVDMLLDTLSPTHLVSRMRARMIDGQSLFNPWS